jgi:hypothetical protein
MATMIAPEHGGYPRSLLTREFFVFCAIAAMNFLIGVAAPITSDVPDEVESFDGVWRAVQGQRLGVDYHDPLGFGPSKISALIWHWVGPHYFILHLSAALIAIAIGFCGCVVLHRRLRRDGRLSLLICIALAFTLTAPSKFGGRITDISMSEYFNRLMVGALGVLFLQTFIPRSKAVGRSEMSDLTITAFLLTALASVKISGFVLGVAILGAGCLSHPRSARRLGGVATVLLLFLAMLTLALWAADLSLVNFLHEAILAADARVHFSFYSFYDAAFDWLTFASSALLILCGIALLRVETSIRRFDVVLICASYVAVQLALNLTDSAGSNAMLAPIAAVCLMSLVPEGSQCDQWRFSGQGSNGKGGGLWFLPIPAVIPLALLIITVLPQMMGSLAGVATASSVALGIRRPVVVSAGTGFTLRAVQMGRSAAGVQYALDMQDAIGALSSLHLTRERIATIGYDNPFPILFQSPSPKGVNAWWLAGYSYPRGKQLKWQEVIGDACVVMLPTQDDSVPRGELFDAAAPGLAQHFHEAYADHRWRIYQRNPRC